MRKPAKDEDEITIPHDPVGEQVIIAAACVSDSARADLTRRLKEHHFVSPEHQPIWRALTVLVTKGLEFDPATIKQLAGDTVDLDYLAGLIEARPEVPANLAYHVEQLYWDHARITAVKGPIASLLQSLKDPRSPAERVKALAKQVEVTLDSYRDQKFLIDSDALLAEQIAEIDQRIAGRAVFPYGVQGFDNAENGAPRLIPGAKPGFTTVVTGVSGAGKSVFTACMALGLARQRRKVLYGAWEMDGGMTLELLAGQSLGFSRSALMSGRISPEERDSICARMEQIGRYVKFMKNPYLVRAEQSASNIKGRGSSAEDIRRNLDIIESHIADSACNVFIADLWERCLNTGDSWEERAALFRQREMFQAMQVHGILVQQQKSKEVESRIDKRPCRETVFGSGAWVDISDTLLGVHRPALWKDVPDNTLEILVLKQRWGVWPLLVEFDWNGDQGMVSNGRSQPFMRQADMNEGSVFEPSRSKRQR